ncbi:MAG: 4-carboxy-4-hydroxy-2-oxoadipate aldolase/oxaloacetate decarboxylase [Chloroflexi bacterium]|nr:4-carboxy-4-hydroxy-2-oxoadipate aldolase/oxaloacetate decarboxylase [Chloroflexota bacterium]
MKFAHVYKEIERPSKVLVEGFAQIPSATAHEASGKKGALTSTIKPVAAGMKVCGPALTVLCRSKDNLMLHKAIAVAQPGDVLVVATEDSAEAGFWGEIMTVSAQANSIAGLVIDNCVRDAEHIVASGFPVFARGLSIRGTVKASLGLINHPTVCGEYLVYPGDLVLGDDDGVVIISREEAGEVLENSIARMADEATEIEEEIRKGVLTVHFFKDRLEELGLREE